MPVSAFFGRLGRFATDHRGLVIGVYLVVSLLLLWRGVSIHLESSLAELLPRGNRAAQDFRDLLEGGGTLDRLLVTIRLDGPPGEGGAMLETLSAAAESLTAKLTAAGVARGARYGVGEEDLSWFAGTVMDHLPVLVEKGKAGALRSKLEPGAIRERLRDLGRRARMPGFAGPVKEMAARDPLGLLELVSLPGGGSGGFQPDPQSGLFLSPDGRTLLLAVEAAEPPTRIDFSRRLVDLLLEAEEDLRSEIPSGDRLRFDHAGGHLFALEDERKIRHDAAATSIFALSGIALVYLLVIRRPVLWLVVLVPVVMTTVWTLGLASIYPGRLNMVTVAFAAILLGIGDDAMIHMYLRERQERRSGLAAPHSVVAALAGTGRAVTVATLSTAAAFLALSFVRFRGLAELGVISAMGMLNLLIGVLFFFPAALVLLARRREPASPPSLLLPIEAVLRVHDWARTRRRAVLGVTGFATAVMLAAAMSVEVSTDLRSIRGDDPAAEAMRRVLEPFNGAATETMVVLHGPGTRAVDVASGAGMIDRALMEADRLREFCRHGIETGILGGCDNPSILIPPRAAQKERFEMAGILPWAQVVETLQREASAAGMDSAFFTPFTTAALQYARFEKIRVEPGPGTFEPPGTPRTRVYFREQARAPEIAAGIRTALEDPDARIASVALVSDDLGRIISSDFRRATLIVAVAVGLLALLAFRAVGVVLVTLAPVALGTVWLLGATRLAGVQLNLMSLMGMPVVFGLGVDYGVYLVDRWSRCRRDPRVALAEVGPAILVTGLTTLAGFAALLGASLAGLRSLGFAVVAGAGFTLVAAVVVLPLLLPRGQSFGAAEKEGAATSPRAARVLRPGGA
jgi:predicted RND superfamily exporter protein